MTWPGQRFIRLILVAWSVHFLMAQPSRALSPTRKGLVMLASSVRWIVFCAVIAACAPISAGCVVALPPPATVDGYEPRFYDGYVVYYDADGAPYYYMDDVVYYVPPTHVHYHVLVEHYHTHKARYHRWYEHDGYRYKHYHRVEPHHRP